MRGSVGWMHYNPVLHYVCAGLSILDPFWVMPQKIKITVTNNLKRFNIDNLEYNRNEMKVLFGEKRIHLYLELQRSSTFFNSNNQKTFKDTQNRNTIGINRLIANML